jgi:hypothetical protein
MKLPLLAVVAGIAAGYLLRGRLANLPDRRIRWAPVALLGLAMQLAPLPLHLEERYGLALLITSFVPLGVFVGVNIRLPGAPLIMLGLLLNFAVIAPNGGMPVSARALVASGQGETLSMLIHDGGIRHHLAGDGDVLLFLGDVIPVGGFVGKAVSTGDLAAYAGVAWLIAAGMRPRRREDLVESGVPAAVGAGAS